MSKPGIGQSVNGAQSHDPTNGKLEAILFDTVRLALHNIEIDPARLIRRGWGENISRRTDHYGGRVERTRFTLEIPGGSPHYIACYPASATLITEASLPKVIYGENISLLAPDHVAPALEEWSARIFKLTGLALPPMSDWEIAGRVDVAYAWQVGDLMEGYLKALGALRLPRHRTEAVNATATLYFKNRSRWLRFYDKFAESRQDSATGLLRLETEIRRPKVELKRLARATSMKAEAVLNWDVAHTILGHYLAELGTNLVISDEQRVLNVLMKKCPPPTASRLFGYLALRRTHSYESLRRRGFSRDWLWRNERDLKRKGLGIGTVRSGFLPPLLIPKVYDGSPGRINGVPGTVVPHAGRSDKSDAGRI